MAEKEPGPVGSGSTAPGTPAPPAGIPCARHLQSGKVMSHKKATQAPGAGGEQLFPLGWDAPTSGGALPDPGRGREVQGTSLVHANVICHRVALGSLEEGAREEERGCLSRVLLDDS